MLLKMIKNQCRQSGGRWRGFRLGDNNALLVRIRRRARKNFFLKVERIYTVDKVSVSDPKYGREGGIALRYNEESFELST
ncbi:MAG: hypothetical protein ACTSYF_02305 [Promethearchaeota archaeon]